MKVGLLITSVGNFGQKGFYNAQELGLAKELDKLFDEVIIYKAVPEDQNRQETKIERCDNSTLYQIPVKKSGINGIWDCSVMDKSLDALIYFSDTQLAVPKVYKWCKKNEIRMFPYIGVSESHSTSRIKKLVIDTMFARNIDVYKKCICFVKTPAVEKQLQEKGVNKTVVIPVGLDISLLRNNYEASSPIELKQKYGFDETDKVLLFIGRLIEEKQPVKMIEILSEVRKKNRNYKLLMVGKGELRKEINEKINKLGLNNSVRWIEQIPNNDIWELYRLADSFVNLNQQEIFGMAILEAMYYECKVVAWNAPGPNLIIENGVSGWLAKNDKEVIERILNKQKFGESAHDRVLNEFTWESGAKKILSIVGE